MKIFIKILVGFGIFIWFNSVLSFDDYSESKNNKERAVLIEKYLLSHKKQIINFTKKYNIEWNYEITKELDKFDFLIKSLKTVQEKDIEKNRENLIINTIINEIKITNEKLRVLLQEKKYEYNSNNEKIKTSYWLLWIKLSIEINKITKVLDYIDKKDSYKLSKEENNLKKAKKRLEELSYLLKMFWKINFNNEDEIKLAFKKIIISIRKEMKIIKNNL